MPNPEFVEQDVLRHNTDIIGQMLQDYNPPRIPDALFGTVSFGETLFDQTGVAVVYTDPNVGADPYIGPGGGGSRYGSDADALGICDRCGFAYTLIELRYEVQNRIKTGLRVCPTCFDIDNPQYWVGEADVDDSSLLRDPRPDTSNYNARGLATGEPYVFLFNPVTAVLGDVTVTVT